MVKREAEPFHLRRNTAFAQPLPTTEIEQKKNFKL